MRIEAGAAIALTGVALVWVAFNAPIGFGGSEAAEPTAVHAGLAPASASSRPGNEGLSTREADLSSSTDKAVDPAAAASALAPATPASSAGNELPAAWSLADSRVAGDDRTPPIQRAGEEAATPAWQLDNHPAYARREQDRHQAVQRAFVDAADRELPLLDRQIEQGRAMGVPPDQLAKGEEKRRRIAEMRARMQADLAASANAP
ncbi:hypothetical protein [Roseateles sp. L2-2]|uniref:hypothetical protein n=1 Tax=Roseateles sp. L2-2 TaxID=3422597 RepID=UPI003D36A5F9